MRCLSVEIVRCAMVLVCHFYGQRHSYPFPSARIEVRSPSCAWPPLPLHLLVPPSPAFAIFSRTYRLQPLRRTGSAINRSPVRREP